MYIYTLLILFFASLFSIVFMVGKKLVLLKKGFAIETPEVSFGIPHLEKVKHLTIQNIKKYGHISLVVTLRFYMRSTNFLKNKYGEIKTNIKNRSKASHINGEKKEISKFLKIIGEYKHKIREIKHKIKKEENL